MKILDIYKQYDIMPQLAEHQFKVAAVGDLICENFQGDIDRNNIVAACLLHDMGNIVKFDLSKTAEMYTDLLKHKQQRLFWENIKAKYLNKYGTGSHNVTEKIVAELGVNGRVSELVDSVGFSQASDNLATADFGKKICAYSDMRVMPQGVRSLDDRLADLRVRYKNHPEGATNRDKFESALRQIEQQIFSHCNIKPADISEETIFDRKEHLKNFNI